ncbi:MAG TPA: DUF2892 domain-containing protein [Candidatus Syntrophosphaera sp.]|nr:DUF2892 domain-containing protein [Candidatus Syntrophosphaera sp.]
MKKNVGINDKIIRFIIAAVIIALAIIFKSWWGLLALIPLATALIGFCPLYTLFGISTCKVKKS